MKFDLPAADAAAAAAITSSHMYGRGQNGRQHHHTATFNIYSITYLSKWLTVFQLSKGFEFQLLLLRH